MLNKTLLLCSIGLFIVFLITLGMLFEEHKRAERLYWQNEFLTELNKEYRDRLEVYERN